jgi:hypothetical protein
MRRRVALTALLLPFVQSARAQMTSTKELYGAEITLALSGDAPIVDDHLIWSWIAKSAYAVHVYYGRFPVPAVAILIRLQAGKGVKGGRTFPGDVPNIEIRVGADSTENDLLYRDWVMVHEMVHLAFPWMDLQHNWMAEGLAVYVESIARLQAGHVSREHVWGDFVRMMPRGLPEPGDQGLDVTVSWGRTYWGGAIFCLLADVRIRRDTLGRIGLQHALRAINAERDFRRQWDFRETLAIGDSATNTTTLTSQYENMRTTPTLVDLDSMWTELGVIRSGNAISLNDGAPLANIRRSIESRML